jgi:hypothetical protein
MKTVIYYLFLLLLLTFATCLVSAIVRWYSPDFPAFWVFGLVFFAVGTTAMYGWKENKIDTPYSELKIELEKLRREKLIIKQNLEAKSKSLGAITEIAKNNKAKSDAKQKEIELLQAKIENEVSKLQNELANSNMLLATQSKELYEAKAKIEDLEYLQDSADFYDKLTKEFPDKLKTVQGTLAVAKFIKENELLFIGNDEQQLELLTNLSRKVRGRIGGKKNKQVDLVIE